MSWKKALKEIQEQKRIQEERYPENFARSGIDPTQSGRDYVKNILSEVLNKPLDQSMSLEKTPKEIEEQKKLQEKRYPDNVEDNSVDPTQAARNLMAGFIDDIKVPPSKSLSLEKTPEEIENQKRIQAKRYPENVSGNSVDPTQANRDFIKNLLSKTNTPMGKSLRETPKDQFEMSPKIKQYGYDLFGMNRFEPTEEQDLSSVQESLPKEQTPRTPSGVTSSNVRTTQQSSMPTNLAKQQEEVVQPSEPQVETYDIGQMIKQSEKDEDAAALWRQTAKLRDAVMGAGSGTILKTDTELYDYLEKKAKRPLQNLFLKDELTDKKAKTDPNSSISTLMRKSLSELGLDMAGFEGVSYSQLEKLYPSLAQTLHTKIAADAKKEENQIRRSEAANVKLEKLDQNKQKELVKHIDYSINNLKKSYENYSKAQTGIDSISTILGQAKNKIEPGQADVTMLYTFISNLDPASTVREGEIALTKSSMSLWGRLRAGTARLTGGDLLDPATRKSIEEIMKVIQTAREKQFAKQKANMIQAGIGKGLDKDMLNSYIYPEIDASSALVKSKKEEVSGKESVTFPKQYKAGNVITLKDGTQYIVQEDGVTGVKK